MESQVPNPQMPETEQMASMPASANAGQPHKCSCQSSTSAEQFIYALGKIDVRFPSL